MRKYILIYFLFALTLPANANNQIIPTVIVKAKKNNRPSLTSGPKSTFTQTELAHSGATTLAQALQNIGGIQLQDMVGNNSQVPISLRGFGANASSNTLLLVNGIPLTNPDLAPPDLNAIPLNDIQAIEIIAGSESVLYGDQAVGGVINIITEEKNPANLLLSCGTGSYNQSHCYAAIHHNFYQVKTNLNAGIQHTDNYRDHNDYDQHYLSGKLTYLYATGRLHFNYQLSSEDMQFPGALTAAQVRQDRRQANNDIDFFTDWNSFLHLRHEQSLNSHWKLETDLARRDTHGHGVLSVPFNQTRTVYYLKPQLKANIHSLRLVSGIDLQNDVYHLGSDAFAPTNNHQQKYGLFGVANLSLPKNWELSFGARGAQQNSKLDSYTSNDSTHRALATTVGLNYSLTTDTHFYLRRAGSFRFPKADENSAVAEGVTALRTQRGIAYETGIQMERENNTAKFGLYQLNLRDEIMFDPTQTPQAPFGSNVNLAPTERRGLSLSGKHKLTKSLTLDGQYHYVRAQFQDGIYSGNRIPLVAENLFHSGIQYHFNSHWQTYAEAIYTGNQYAANDNANVAGKMGGYTVYNFNLRYIYQNFSAALRINNAFNKEYYFYTVYQPSMQAEFFYPAPERNVSLVIKYLFI